MSTANILPEPPIARPPSAVAPIIFRKINFEALGLPEYKESTAIVIDNLFTPDDCAAILRVAESSKTWEKPPRSGKGMYNMPNRNSSRILLNNYELGSWILERLRPYLKEIETEVAELHHIFGNINAPPMDWDAKAGPVAKLTRVNERLRFHKYGVGQFLRRHVDGVCCSSDGNEISYYTLQIYLNGEAETLKGGATRIWSQRCLEGDDDLGADGVGKWVDVEARTGRVVVFQQKKSQGNMGIVHSGQKVTHGEKICIKTDLLYRLIVEE